MPPAYHIGAQAIAERLGYRSTKAVTRLILQEGLPVYKRSKKNPVGCTRVLAISESALTAWELSKGRIEVQRRVAKAEAQRLERLTALRVG